MKSIPAELIEAIRLRRVILFVGAGVSLSVGLPSWDDLIQHMAAELGLKDLAIGESQLTYQILAEYYLPRLGSIGPLRSWMDRTWNISAEKISSSKVHDLIVALDFPMIYTTNYDRNLEMAFDLHQKPYVKIANAKDLTRTGSAATQIIKFHGDFDDDTSLVLTETDYFERLSFESPLDVKFRADALGHTLLFVGYSMSDLNIRLLLHKLWQTWNRSHHERERPPSFVFMPQRDEIQEGVLGRWGIAVLAGDEADPEQALYGFLEQLKAMASAPDTGEQVDG